VVAESLEHNDDAHGCSPSLRRPTQRRMQAARHLETAEKKGRELRIAAPLSAK